MKIEDDEIWSRRKLKSKSLKVIKFEIEVWSWSVKLKFESWRNYGWRKLKLINLKLKKFEGSENLNLMIFEVEDSERHLKLLKVIENQRWWNMKQKRSEI